MPSKNRRRALTEKLTGLHSATLMLMTVVVLACGLYWWHLNETQSELHAQTIAQTEQRTRLLTEAVATQTTILVNLVEFAIGHLRNDYQHSGRQPFENAVETVLNAFPPGAMPQVSVIDKDGYIAYTTHRLAPAKRVFIGDRDYFKAHAAGAKDRLIVSKPLRGKITNQWSIYFSRPLFKERRFAGVMVLSLSPEYLASNLAIHGLGTHDVITLFDIDGNFLSRNHDLENAMGKSVPANRPFVGMHAPARGAFRAIASFDQVPRTFAWRRIEAYPLIALVGIDERDVLAPVDRALARERRQNLAGIVIVLLLAAGMATLLVQIAARQRALAESEDLYRTLFEAANEGILVTDAENRIVAVNPAFTAITGYASADVLGKNPSQLASGLHNAAFYQTMWHQLATQGRWEGEILNRRKDGAGYVEWLRVSAIVDADGQARRYVGLFSDITEKKQKEETIWRKANFDLLTGLPNRQLLEDRLDRAITQASRRHSEVAVLFIDLDHFKPVNDNHGHAVGDELLRQVAARLRNILRDEDTIARLGGDEFVAVLSDLGTSEAPENVAEKIVSSIAAPFRVGDTVLDISCCVGIAVYPRDGETGSGLIKAADSAMYVAKQAGRSAWKTIGSDARDVAG